MAQRTYRANPTTDYPANYTFEIKEEKKLSLIVEDWEEPFSYLNVKI